MTAATLALAEFLLSRITEDEEAARASNVARWAIARDADLDKPWLILGRAEPAGHVFVGEVYDTTAAAHIARHDPARVLADCEAKRMVVESCNLDGREGLGPDGYVMADIALCCLALPYADHPDYRDEWKP